MKSKEEFISDIYDKQKKYERRRLRAIRRTATLCAPLAVGITVLLAVWFNPIAFNNASGEATNEVGTGESIDYPTEETIASEGNSTADEKDTVTDALPADTAATSYMTSTAAPGESTEQTPGFSLTAEAVIMRIRNRNGEVMSYVSAFLSVNTDSEKAREVTEMAENMTSLMALAEAELSNADLTSTDSAYIQSVTERLADIELEHAATANAVCDYIGVD